MDEEDEKKLVAAFTLGALTLSAAYLLKDELLSILKEVKGEEEKEKAEKKIEKEKEKKEEREGISVKLIKETEEKTYEDLWRGMTWEKLKKILGNRYTGANIMEAYSHLTEEERMKWRKALREDSLTQLDKQFVYLDSYMTLRAYPSRNLSIAFSQYRRGKIPFEELFRAYKEEIQKLYG